MVTSYMCKAQSKEHDKYKPFDRVAYNYLQFGQKTTPSKKHLMH